LGLSIALNIYLFRDSGSLQQINAWLLEVNRESYQNIELSEARENRLMSEIFERDESLAEKRGKLQESNRRYQALKIDRQAAGVEFTELEQLCDEALADCLDYSKSQDQQIVGLKTAHEECTSQKKEKDKIIARYKESLPMLDRHWKKKTGIFAAVIGPGLNMDFAGRLRVGIQLTAGVDVSRLFKLIF
jgi:hypothetical protein